MAPTGSFSPSSAGTVARVGDKVKVDKWTEFGEWTEFGVKYYHNPAKPNETAWEKPEDFDKQKNAGKPAAPTKPEVFLLAERLVLLLLRMVPYFLLVFCLGVKTPS